ncbi:ABC transporter substrate-binding protein [Alphaproteobacteria bacterium]|nr:ABC transporter substrate-binding protein [Alphaproteobacteria bacterium]
MIKSYINKLIIGLCALFIASLAPITASSDELKVAVRMFASGKGNTYTGCMCTPGVYTWSAQMETLTKLNKDGSISPFLAERWENIEPTKWRFHLKKGVKFSNGEPLTAQAVKSTFDFWKTDQGGAWAQGKTMKGFVADSIVVDDHTIDIITTKPNPIMPKNIRDPSVLAPKAFADVGAEGFSKAPVASGPYIVTYGEESATAVPNPNAWRKAGSIKKIVWTALPEATARTQALISGQIDINTAISPDEAIKLESQGIKVYARPSTRTMGITLVSVRNKKAVDGPIGDVRVRQALNYAVNRDAIVDALFFGKYGRPSTQPAFPGVNGYDASIKGYNYDPAKAKKLLAEAGYADGFDFEVRAIVNDENFKNFYEAVIADVKALGINATLIGQPFAGAGNWLEHWLKGDWPYQGFGIGFDLTSTMDAGRVWNVFASCKKSGGKAPYFCDQGMMPAIEAANQEFDPVKRKKMLQDLGRVTTEKAPIIFGVEFDELMAHSPKVKNFSHVGLWIPYEKLSKN